MTRLVQRNIILPRHLPVPLRRWRRCHPTRPRRRQYPIGVITPIRQQILRRNAVSQRLRPGTVGHSSRRSQHPNRHSVGVHRQVEFGSQPPLARPTARLPPTAPRAVLTHLDIAAVNHQPLQIGVIGQGVQELFPCAIFLPVAEAIVGRTPVSVVRGQVAPGGAVAQNPEYAIDEAAVVLCGASYFAGAAGEERFQCFSGVAGSVVAVIAGSRGHASNLRLGIAWRSHFSAKPSI